MDAAWLARTVYSAVLWLMTPLLLARYWWRGRKEPGYRQHLCERLGYAEGPPETGRLWIHAVSLGETRAAASLIEALRRQRPGVRLLLTHGTATGRDSGSKLLHAGDAVAWLPIDTPGAVRRFLQQHQPRLGALMETEVWPNLLHAAQIAGVPMVLVNARLSARSAARGRRLPALLYPAMRSLRRVLAQTEGDAQRIRATGVPGAHVQVIGNLKFDMNPPARLLARGIEWRQALQRPVVLAAVTRKGEEQPLLQAWRSVAAPRPLLLLVPRHPQRFEEVAALVNEAGMTLALRSSWAQLPPPEAFAADVWIGDSLGEMPLYYAMADAALLGGSFAPLGGQNLIEAAACGCPLVMGPHTFNFAQAAELSLAAGAAVRAADIDAAVPRAVALALDPDRNAWVQRALAFAASHRGAADRMAYVLLSLMPR
ncbi:MAG TPA: 3-deoxy-D-manno-octulosonic acid transferase [Rubrivivax sp.]|nr:3-deoxy-D-manno-octulosonic acid transferase [Rubrivivax sp.]